MPPTRGKDDTPTRCAICLRISQDREADGLAIERQREDCENLAKYRRWEVVETYIDESKSATDKTKTRDGYDRMVADWQSGAFDAIICWDLDRLTRQPRHSHVHSTHVPSNDDHNQVRCEGRRHAHR